MIEISEIMLLICRLAKLDNYACMVLLARAGKGTRVPIYPQVLRKIRGLEVPQPPPPPIYYLLDKIGCVGLLDRGKIGLQVPAIQSKVVPGSRKVGLLPALLLASNQDYNISLILVIVGYCRFEIPCSDTMENQPISK